MSREGTFFVTGNHEYFVPDPTRWLRELERLGVQPLRNENTVIRRGGAAFDLAGVNDISGDSPSTTGPDFDRALSGRDSSQADGSARAPTGSGGRRRPRTGWTCSCPATRTAASCGRSTTSSALQQAAVAGLSTVDNTQLYVTRGAGYWGPPVRVGAPPDITVLSLESED